jgi:hypothetical protein
MSCTFRLAFRRTLSPFRSTDTQPDCRSVQQAPIKEGLPYQAKEKILLLGNAPHPGRHFATTSSRLMAYEEALEATDVVWDRRRSHE